MSLKENFINECIRILKRDDVKGEIKKMFSPFISILLQEIYPYIFLTLMFVIFIFVLILAILIILLRTHTKLL